MTTSGIRAAVSTVAVAAALAATGTLVACSRATSPVTGDETAATPQSAPVIRFHNDAQRPVVVYLVGELREWRLGRVPPGGRVTFPIPEEVLTARPQFGRLAVLADVFAPPQAALDPRATSTMMQPMSRLVEQRWTYWPGPASVPALLGTQGPR